MLPLGVGAFVGLMALSILLRVQRKISDPFAAALCTFAMVCLWMFPQAGAGFRAELPGLTLETITRAEQAAARESEPA